METAQKEQLLKYTVAKLAEAPILVRNHIKRENTILRYRKGYFRIQKYVDSFLSGTKDGLNTRLIILPGLRGVGKTTILYQIYDYLKTNKSIEQDRILYFSTDELKSYLGLNILDVIDTYVQEIHKTTLVNLDKELFVLVDESHFDSNWSQTAKVIFDKTDKIFLIFTGSSALNLELNADAARRTTKEIVYPLNFSEYLTLKYNPFLPPKGMAESIRKLIFEGTLESSLSTAKKCETELLKKTISFDRSLDKIWEDYLCYHGFPFSLDMNTTQIHEKTFSMIDRVIEKDVFSIKTFNTDTRNTISRILTYLALQSPGGTSDSKLSDSLSISPTLIRGILDVLEKTHLIFSIKPYGGAGKVIRKPWKYYYLTPSLTTSIRFKLGAFDKTDRKVFGLLAESLVASYFLRTKETVGTPQGIFYDPEEGHADFLLIDGHENVIPIEVSVGKKDSSQVRKSMSKYNSKYGIIVCECLTISKKDDIIYIPIQIFSVM